MKDDLVSALEQSLTDGTKDIAASIIQMGIDAILKDCAFQGIPIVATVASVYKIGHSIKELHYIKKLAQFVFALNFGVETEEQRQYYIGRVQEDRDQANKELEYILVVLDRYIQFSKADMLAKLYLAYLRKEITWDSFSVYSEVVDRLMPGDYEELEKGNQLNISDKNVSDHLLRLIAMGLMVSHVKDVAVATTVGSISIPAQTEKDYEITAFGKTFLECLSK